MTTDTDNAERAALVARMLRLYGRVPEPLLVADYCSILDDLPPAVLSGCIKRACKAKGNGFPPAPGEILSEARVRVAGSYNPWVGYGPDRYEIAAPDPDYTPALASGDEQRRIGVGE